jgi:hypothetical protein
MKSYHAIIRLILIVAAGNFFFVPRVHMAANIDATVKISICGNGIKEGGEQCDRSDFGGATCSSYGWNGGTLSCTPSCEYTVSFCTSDVEILRDVFSEEGGEAVLDAGDGPPIEISVPPDTYADTLSVNIFPYASTTVSDDDPAPDDASFVGKVYDFVLYDGNGYIVHDVEKPVTITLHYEDADVAELDETSLKPYHNRDDGTGWHAVTPFSLDTILNEITFSAESFSMYSIIGTVPEPVFPETISSIPGGTSSFRHRVTSALLPPIYVTAYENIVEALSDKKITTPSVKSPPAPPASTPEPDIVFVPAASPEPAVNIYQAEKRSSDNGRPVLVFALALLLGLFVIGAIWKGIRKK